jgi:hypothetical protein
MLTVDSSACIPTINIIQIKKPNEIFQNKTFGINVTLQAAQGDALDTNVTILVPEGWEVWNTTAYSNVYYIGTIPNGAIRDAHFDIKPNSSGSFTLMIYANATMLGEAKSSETTTSVFVYKWLTPASALEPSLPKVLNAGESLVASFSCEAGSYRIANLTISSINLTIEPREVLLRVYSYNGTDWIDILHSYKINLTSARNDFVPLLKNQLNVNETGYCKFKISNIGSNDINITGLTLEGYYSETVQIQDIQVKVGEVITTGLEPSEQLFNVTVRIVNSLPSSVSGTLWLNITNSSGYLVNYSSLPVFIAPDSFNLTNFTNINTSEWLADNYNLRAYLTYDGKSTERTEQLTFKSVSVEAKGPKYQCNATTEEFSVTIEHPFADAVEYNVSLQVPAEWSYSPSYILINASQPGSYKAKFNLTAQAGATQNYIINASVAYTYPGISKIKQANYTIQAGNAIPILEIIRETPKIVGKGIVFDSQLSCS